MTHVDYRTGRRLDLRVAHRRGPRRGRGRGVGPVALGRRDGPAPRRDGVDLAVGCTYKYLNGGPGSPAFAYVAARHLAELDQPIPGWVGHADPFSMSEVHVPAPGIRRMLSGTPSVLGLVALDHALDRFDGVDLAELRRTQLSASPTEPIERADALGLEVVTPARPERARAAR